MDGELKKNFSLSNLKVFRHACPMGLWRNGFLGKCGAPIPPWEIEWHVCKHNFVWNFVKVHTFWEGHKILRNLNLTFCPMQSQSKVRWRFRKILLPSQNIWTLEYFLKEMQYDKLALLFRSFLGLLKHKVMRIGILKSWLPSWKPQALFCWNF